MGSASFIAMECSVDSIEPGRREEEQQNSLDSRGQTNGILVELGFELINHFQLPSQPRDLPRSQSKADDRHDTENIDERSSARRVGGRRAGRRCS